jgi:uncharacterized membrane-anchored protein YhcB (DUF1043 family)
MEFLYLFIGIVIGTTVGFLVSKKLSASEQDYKTLELEANETKSSLEKYQNDVAVHLESSAQLLQQMNSTCKIAMEQMEKSTSLLNKATQEPVAGMPFFSKEAEEHLRANPDGAKLSRNEKNKTFTEPPLDYSSAPSGLFSDDKQIVTNSSN